ncbi:MAG: RNA-directed DNA polymerase [Desulfarculaceae bacterium]|nr:RNA-directed DNA polymerase [Desulfarculaceae bacterium]MCF8124285.1 RNA-directed DNA polymerase [Desulfarculaceae bacterium]
MRLASRSNISLTKPGIASEPRAINPQYDMNRIPIERAKLRASSKYILTADISLFYPSLYTHSIPWAIHSKEESKLNRSDDLIGNLLDKLVRNAQDGQTHGIPIGPDTSLLIAEIILGSVDEIIMLNVPLNGYRYIDDYELGFKTRSEAELVLAIMQETLNQYELSLNPKKTCILDLPVPLETPWVSSLRSFPFKGGNNPKTQEYDLLRFFDLAFQLSAEYPGGTVLRYAIARTNGINIKEENWLLFQNLLAQCCIIEPGVLSKVITQLARYKEIFDPSNDIFYRCFNYIITIHAPLGHGSEVAWAIWCLILLEINLSEDAVKFVAKMEDAIVALLALDAENKGLITNESELEEYAKFINSQELYGPNWLLAYEANIKGWLQPAGVQDYVHGDEGFKFLKEQGVSFYDNSLTIDSIVGRPVTDQDAKRFPPSGSY